jgi:cytoskeletal protein RodZ
MTDSPSPNPGSAPRPSRRIPPLVWIILAILVGWGVVLLVQNNGTTRTPNQSYPAAEGDTNDAVVQPSVVPPPPAENPNAVTNPDANAAEVDGLSPNEQAPEPRSTTPGGGDQGDSPINAGQKK